MSVIDKKMLGDISPARLIEEANEQRQREIDDCLEWILKETKSALVCDPACTAARIEVYHVEYALIGAAAELEKLGYEVHRLRKSWWDRWASRMGWSSSFFISISWADPPVIPQPPRGPYGSSGREGA